MALINISNQYRYAGRGPFDAKTLVKTQADLLKTETWQVTEGSKTVTVAYNGLIVAVWADKDTSLNGIYYLHDKSVTSVLKTPDFTSLNNWNRLCSIDDFKNIKQQLEGLSSAVETVAAKVAELNLL